MNTKILIQSELVVNAWFLKLSNNFRGLQTTWVCDANRATLFDNRFDAIQASYIAKPFMKSKAFKGLIFTEVEVQI
jgi:hypothetical protein